MLEMLDLTRIRAGPTAVRQPVDRGAEAIKIEAPAALETGTDMGGPRGGSDFQNLNCGKRSLTLDRAAECGGVACGPIYRVDEMFDDGQVRHLGPVRQVRHEQLGTVKVLSQAIRLSAPQPVEKTAAPERGQHTDDILKTARLVR
jgi:crotonobetainyl-CoA:carnitine CoA-transferase CaiB-like acyl-CoA transferase